MKKARSRYRCGTQLGKNGIAPSHLVSHWCSVAKSKFRRVRIVGTIRTTHKHTHARTLSYSNHITPTLKLGPSFHPLPHSYLCPRSLIDMLTQPHNPYTHTYTQARAHRPLHPHQPTTPPHTASCWHTTAPIEWASLVSSDVYVSTSWIFETYVHNRIYYIYIYIDWFLISASITYILCAPFFLWLWTWTTTLSTDTTQRSHHLHRHHPHVAETNEYLLRQPSLPTGAGGVQVRPRRASSTRRKCSCATAQQNPSHACIQLVCRNTRTILHSFSNPLNHTFVTG